MSCRICLLARILFPNLISSEMQEKAIIPNEEMHVFFFFKSENKNRIALIMCLKTIAVATAVAAAAVVVHT